MIFNHGDDPIFFILSLGVQTVERLSGCHHMCQHAVNTLLEQISYFVALVLIPCKKEWHETFVDMQHGTIYMDKQAYDNSQLFHHPLNM